MKKINLLPLACLAIPLFLNHATAAPITYSVSLFTQSVEDSTAFGGTSNQDVFSGFFSADSTELGNIVSDFGDTTIIDPLQLSYNFTIGSHNYSYTYDPIRDYISDPDFGLGSTTLEVSGNGPIDHFNVTDVTDFIFEQSGDADSYELNIDTQLGTWSAFDDSTGFMINGNVSINKMPMSVPEPSIIWLFGGALLGLIRTKKLTKITC